MPSVPRKARIVIVDSSPGVTGGLRCVSNMARLLAPWADTTLVLPEKADIEATELQNFAEVVRLPIVQLRKSAAALAIYAPALALASWRLRRLLASLQADILVINDFNLMQGAGARLLGFGGRIVTWVRFDPAWFPPALSKSWLAAGLWASDAIVAVSNFILARLEPSPKVTQIYDCLNPDLERAPVGGTHGGGDIVFVGNYTPSKGQHHAIEAFSRIQANVPDARLIFHGGDLGLEKNREYRRQLETMAASSSPGRIIFHDFAEDIGQAFSGAAVALNLSQTESFSLTCLEASQLGVPVVAFRSGGPEEIIEDGVTGYLCSLGDVAAVAEALEQLLSQPALRARMGTAGADRVRQRFGEEAFVAACRKLFRL